MRRRILLALGWGLVACGTTPVPEPQGSPAPAASPEPVASAEASAPVAPLEPTLPIETPEPAEPPAAEGAAAPAASDGVAETVSAAPAPDAPAGMLRVPGGTFTMGADRGGEADERPAHAVRVRSFWLDRTEVTNDAYGRCVAASVCRPRDTTNASHNNLDDRRFRGPRQPITGVSWDDAATYCRWVGARLPTEAEWERAARGDDARVYPWGKTPPTPKRAVFGTDATADVGSRPTGAGPYGHLDLAGNVWEWTADEYDPVAYTRPTAAQGVPGDCKAILAALDQLRRKRKEGFTGSNPIPTECEHVLRGGAFNYTARGLRTTNRVHHPGRYRLVMAGFRCARDEDGPADAGPDGG